MGIKIVISFESYVDIWRVSQGERILVSPVKKMHLLVWGTDLQGWVRFGVRKQAPLIGATDPEFLENPPQVEAWGHATIGI